MKILLIEDDAILVKILTEALMAYHYTVDAVTDGETGLEWAHAYEYDLILLDIVLPKLDGISLCRQLRLAGSQIPILLLTARDHTTDRINGLEAGADDYVVKPFEVAELVARIRALTRRRAMKIVTVETLQWEQLQLNLETGTVTYGENQIHLTPKEFGLMELFLRHPQRIFSRSVILDRLWSADEFPQEEAVTTHIKGLRQKLKAAGMALDWLETIYGMGYRLKTPPVAITQKPMSPEHSEASQPLEPNTSSGFALDKRKAAEAKVKAMVAQFWEEFQKSLPHRLALLEQAANALSQGTLNPELRQQAMAEAHQLIGSLGSFGVPQGSQVARHMETLLKQSPDQGPDIAQQLGELVESLRQITLNAASPQPAATPPLTTAARILVIDDDPILTKQIQLEATAWEFQIQVATDLTTARDRMLQQTPDVILLDLSFPHTEENGLTLLAELNEQQPQIPVLVMTGAHQLQDRLQVARLGGQAFLQKPITVHDIFQVVQTVLQPFHPTDAKIMIVDDDPSVLATLRLLLRPWGFQVTTLEHPQRFWEVLESAAPDLLILDVEMPNYNGIELCQIVRNDSRWNQLPILILSAHSEAQTVYKVFAVGADDYINKPIVGPELIARILNRLERVQMRQKLEAVSRSKSTKNS